jgi:predicted GNAT superfamily acetyltransferase
MMSLYAQYVAEKDGMSVLEKEHGFAVFRVQSDTVYLRDIFVVEAKRKTHLAKEMADEVAEIARRKGCKYMTGTVNPNLPSATNSILVLAAYGMNLISANQDALLFGKEI